jgi:hypothetical protein
MFDMDVQSMSMFLKYPERNSPIITHLHSGLHELVEDESNLKLHSL